MTDNGAPSATTTPNAAQTQASRPGRFGEFGGTYVPETLIHALQELEAVYESVRHEGRFWDQLEQLLKEYVGRPTPLCPAERLTGFVRARAGKNRGAAIWLKREDLAHTGAHKINNTIAQALLAKRMDKSRLIAETGAGQHGVATATAAACFGLACEVYMGKEDARRQRLNVVRMKMLGAEVHEVTTGSQTLKDATNEAMRDWMRSVENTHYVLGSVVGPHPFPIMVRDFQSVIGAETKGQTLRAIGALPNAIVACVGGGSNAAGMFHPFIDDEGVRLIGVEAGGTSSESGEHAATLRLGERGVLHGTRTIVLRDEFGQTSPVHSCSAGLDYPGVGPEHAHWKQTGRVEYVVRTDAQALDAFSLLSQSEGIIPALETAHAVSEAIDAAGAMPRDEHLVICLSGRGDKDVEEAAKLLNMG